MSSSYQGPPPGHEGGYPPVADPPRKKSIFKRWWFWLGVVILLIIIASVAGSGGGDEDTPAAADPPAAVVQTPTAPPAAKPAAPAPAPTTEAPAAPATSAPASKEIATDGDWTLVSVKVEDDGLGDFGATARIRYNGEDPDAAGVFTVTVLDESGEVLGALQGSATQVEPGKVQTVQMISTDKFAKGPYTYEFQKDF